MANQQLWLTRLTAGVSWFLDEMDTTMKTTSPSRDQEITELVNRLRLMHDEAVRFGRGKPLRSED